MTTNKTLRQIRNAFIARDWQQFDNLKKTLSGPVEIRPYSVVLLGPNGGIVDQAKSFYRLN